MDEFKVTDEWAAYLFNNAGTIPGEDAEVTAERFKQWVEQLNRFTSWAFRMGIREGKKRQEASDAD